jgi:hypothetical protein
MRHHPGPIYSFVVMYLFLAWIWRFSRNLLRALIAHVSRSLRMR